MFSSFVMTTASFFASSAVSFFSFRLIDFNPLYTANENERTEIKIVNSKVTEGGSYNKYKHTVELNAKAYQAGVFDLDETIINEAMRAREALLRTAILEEKANKLASEQLSSKIIPVENGKIIVKDSPLGVKLIDTPLIPPKPEKNPINNKTNILHKNESIS